MQQHLNKWRCGLRVLSLLSVIVASGGTARAQQNTAQNDLVFHFNFAGAAGKKEVADETGRFQAVSRVGTFAIEHGGLRIDNGAQIFIPSEKLPPLDKQLTISLWIAKAHFGYTSPLLFKGIHPQPIQFSFSVAGRLPQFNYKNDPQQSGWKGLYAVGSDYASNQTYAQPEWKIAGEEPRITQGIWSQIAVTFNRGDIRVYRDGRLVAQEKSPTPELLTPNKEPLWLGAERVPNDTNNYLTADAILNDVRLYQRALGAAEIAALYRAERNSYPTASLIPEGLPIMPPNNSYLRALHPDYDPDFTRTLKRTARYEKQLPVPVGNIKNSSLVARGGQLELAINGRPEAPAMLFPLLVRDNKLRLAEVRGVTRDFAAGVDLVATSSIPPTFWLGDGQYDWKLFDSVFETMIEANPRAKIMANLFLRPPQWFFTQYPDEMEHYLDASGQSQIFYTAGPFGSELWLQTSLKMLRDVVTHVESSPYAGHVFGYLPSGGDAGEWYWAGSFTGGWPGYSLATEKSFQKWLAQKYADDAALQSAWHDKAVTLTTAKVPPIALREASEQGWFRVPEQARPVFDFRAFLNEKTYLNIAETCRAIKAASSSQKIVCIYYGYSLLYAGKQSTMQMGGLQNLAKVLANPDIDLLATPLDYVQRRGGQPGLNINGYNGSARLHRKMLWQENDLRTHFLISPNFGRTADMKETLSVMNRGLGHVLTNGGGLWWNLLDGNALFHEETIMDAVGKIKNSAQDALQADRTPQAQVAFFLDENSLNYTGIPQSDFMDRTTWGAYEAASMMGAPSDFYLLSDIDNPRLPNYKLYIFLNAFQMDAAKREAIARQVRKNNAVAVWCYAPGFINENGFDTKLMQQLTGIHLDKEDSEKTLNSTVTAPQNPIMKYVKKLEPVTLAPRFYAADAAAQALAEAGGKPVIAAREFKTWRSVYSMLPLSKELLMGLCDYAGVPVYSRSFDVFNANKSYLMLHTVSAGEKTITLPAKSDVTEILGNKVVARNAKTFSENLEAGVTRIYRVNQHLAKVRQ